MSPKNEPGRQYEETFMEAAVEFLDKKGGGVKAAAAELGLNPAELRIWKRKAGGRARPVKALSSMAQLRAENEALRSQIVHLEGTVGHIENHPGRALHDRVLTRKGP